MYILCNSPWHENIWECANAIESNLMNFIQKSNQINKQTKWLQRVQAMPLFVSIQLWWDKYSHIFIN